MPRIATTKNQESPIKPHYRHGFSKHPLYMTWRTMLHRCYSEKQKHYSYYGGKGVRVDDRWLDKKNGLKNFIEDMGNKPTPIHTLDRIDSNGHYTKSNCRWADRKEQSRNKAVSLKNKSGQKGVLWNKKSRVWIAQIGVNKTNIHLGSFKNVDDAIKSRLEGEKALWL